MVKETGSPKLLFEKFSAPNELWIFENVRADELATYASRLKKIPMKGARFAYND